MADDTPAPAPATTLKGDAAAARTQIEAWRADSSSPYYKGTDSVSAAWIQQHDRDLIRGELAGAPGAIGPGYEPDTDCPLHQGGYDISGAANARSMTAHDREVADSFMAWAWSGGIGQARYSQACGWVLSGAAATIADFRRLAEAAGWSDAHIKVCVGFYNAATGAQPRGPGGQFATAPSVAAEPNAARKAEIESQMYLPDGKPGPYWADAAMQAEYRQLL